MVKLNATIAILILVAISLSCSNNDDVLTDYSNEKVYSLKTNSVDPGILAMASKDVFDEVVGALANQNGSEKREWENSLGYKSLQSIVNEKYKAIDQIENEGDLLSFLDANSKYLSIKTIDGESYITPVVDHPLFCQLANDDGLFIVGESVYKVFEDILIITNRSNLNKVKHLKISEVGSLSKDEYFIFNHKGSKKTISETSMTAYLEEGSCKYHRCIVTRMGSNAVPYTITPGIVGYKTGVYVNIESWRKSFLCYWYQYATIITRNDASYEYVLYGTPGSDTWPDYTTPTEENGLLRWLLLEDWGTSGNPSSVANFSEMHAATTHRGMDGTWCNINYSE